MPAAARRPSLTRDRIVEAALAIVDENGLDSLSLRGVAARLGVTPMPLYRHVANGDELTDLVVEALLVRDAEAEAWPEDWETFLRVVANRTRATMLRHPAVYDALRRRALTTGPATDGLEQLLRAFDRAGMRASDAVAAYSCVLMHVLGNVALLHGRRTALEAVGRSVGEERARVAASLDELDPVRFAFVTRASQDVVRLLDDDVFEWGLDAIIAGLRTTLPVSGSQGSG